MYYLGHWNVLKASQFKKKIPLFILFYSRSLSLSLSSVNPPISVIWSYKFSISFPFCIIQILFLHSPFRTLWPDWTIFASSWQKIVLLSFWWLVGLFLQCHFSVKSVWLYFVQFLEEIRQLFIPSCGYTDPVAKWRFITKKRFFLEGGGRTIS